MAHGIKSGRLRGAGLAALLLLSRVMAAPGARAQASKSLQIYFVDVEGGQATLFVTPAGQSLLIDTGWPDFNGRDADRIVAAARKAGVTKIDYVLITHFHADHVGGAPQLADRIPIGTFIDHGELRETTDAPTVMVEGAYRKLLATGKYQHIVAKPGDALPIQGMQATIVSADAATIANPLPGGGQKNSACAGLPQYPEDKTENRRSLGTVINFGKLRIVDLGDLTHDEEVELMCPVNKLGHADIYIVSHHGWDQSSSPALVWGLAPRVAIMDNGAKKGGSPSVWDIIEKSPGLENLWQLHFADEGGAAHNVAEEFIANPDGPDSGNYLEVIAHRDGSFAVFNSRTGKTKDYPFKETAHDPSPYRPDSRAGVEILTPTEGVDFGSYLQNTVAMVKRNWYAKMPKDARAGAKGKVVAVFRVLRDGNIEKVSLVASSGNDLFDQAAVNAINAANPLAPLPAQFRGPYIDLRFGFSYNLPIDDSGF
jgi:competence protein ComEC